MSKDGEEIQRQMNDQQHLSALKSSLSHDTNTPLAPSTPLATETLTARASRQNRYAALAHTDRCSEHEACQSGRSSRTSRSASASSSSSSGAIHHAGVLLFSTSPFPTPGKPFQQGVPSSSSLFVVDNTAMRWLQQLNGNRTVSVRHSRNISERTLVGSSSDGVTTSSSPHGNIRASFQDACRDTNLDGLLVAKLKIRGEQYAKELSQVEAKNEELRRDASAQEDALRNALNVAQRLQGQMEEMEQQRAASEDSAQKMDELEYRIAPLERLFRQKSSAFDEMWQQLDNTESELRMREQHLELAELSQLKTEMDLCLCSRELEAARTRVVEYNQACADYSSGRIAERDRHLELKDAMIRDLQQERDQALQLLEAEQYARKEMNKGFSTKLTSSRQADWISKERGGPVIRN